MERVKYNDTFIYVDDSPLDEKETGRLIRNISSRDNIDSISKVDDTNSKILSDTITDLWGMKDE